MAILRRKNLAALLGVSVRTIFRWEQEDILPPALIIGPRVVGWDEDEIHKFIASRKRRATSCGCNNAK